MFEFLYSVFMILVMAILVVIALGVAILMCVMFGMVIYDLVKNRRV